MQKEEWQGIAHWRANQPIFGRLSLWVLAAAALIASLLVLLAFIMPNSNGDCMGNLGYIALGVYLGGAMCVVNVGIALTGLARKETPRRPAISGLILSVPPAIGGVHLVFDGGGWLLLGMGAVAVFLVATVRMITLWTIQHFFPKSVP